MSAPVLADANVAGIVGGSLAGVVVVALFILSISVKIVTEYERAVFFRFGRIKSAAKGPGIITRIPGVDRVVKVNLRVEVIDIPPQSVRKLDIPPEVRDPIMQGLQGVTTDPRGTAAGAFAGFPFSTFPAAGKTGTAQAGNKQDTSLFVAFGPTFDPQYAVGVVMEEAGFGASAAAPVARRILESLAGKPTHPVSYAGGASPD